jgi:hypothetical protein
MLVYGPKIWNLFFVSYLLLASFSLPEVLQYSAEPFYLGSSHRFLSFISYFRCPSQFLVLFTWRNSYSSSSSTSVNTLWVPTYPLLFILSLLIFTLIPLLNFTSNAWVLLSSVSLRVHGLFGVVAVGTPISLLMFLVVLLSPSRRTLIP